MNPLTKKSLRVSGRFSVMALCLLLVFVWLAWPQPALAQEGAVFAAMEPVASESGEVKPCTSCHEDEASSWMASPHATITDADTGLPVAECSSCHGDYVRGHPDEAMTPLRADSSSCQDCHAATFTQWEESIHGGEGVQCISCHQPHSQEVRLTDERQCTACHQESLGDPMHTAHWEAQTACTDCHMAEIAPSEAMAMLTATDAALASVLPATNHDFVSVSASNCLGCHAEDVTAPRPASWVKSGEKALETERQLSETTSALEKAKQGNRNLTIFSLANLGFGVGIGGILGIVFMVAFVRFVAPSKKESDRE